MIGVIRMFIDRLPDFFALLVQDSSARHSIQKMRQEMDVDTKDTDDLRYSHVVGAFADVLGLVGRCTIDAPLYLLVDGVDAALLPPPYSGQVQTQEVCHEHERTSLLELLTCDRVEYA